MEKTQIEKFYEVSRKIAETNETFLELVKTGLTKQDLIRNIERRPSLWKRFESWIDKLPGSQGGV